MHATLDPVWKHLRWISWVLCWDLPFLSKCHPLVHLSDQCRQVQQHSNIVKTLLGLIVNKLWPLTSYSLPDKWRIVKWGVFDCDTLLFGAFKSTWWIDSMSPLYCKMKSSAERALLTVFLFHRCSFDAREFLRGITFYLSQLLIVLWFPRPQRLKVTRRGQCSQRFPSPAKMWVLDIPLCAVFIQY